MKNVNDYLEEVNKEFPFLDKSDIQIILNYGFRKLYQFNLAGCDTLIKSTKYKLWFYVGELQKNPIKHFRYYKKKMIRKVRFTYINRKIEWSGYYYIGLTEEEYNQFLLDINKRGRKKKNFTFNNKIQFKILDEAKLFYSSHKAIIKFSHFDGLPYSIKKETFVYKNPELVLVREHPAKFSDILLENKNYEFL